MDLTHEGYLAGDFTGWDGDTVFEFDNGKKWQQAHYRYRYHYAYRPRAKIWRDGGRYFLEVQGMPEKLEVRRAF